MPKQMLINTVQGQECRIAIVSNEGLEELYVERTSTASRVGNIYKARVTNVESAIQAAFVDTGLGKNGFLHISDVNPTYFPRNKRTVESVGQKRSHYYRPPIQECLRRGQEVVVQMIKEGIGTKGPTMTTYLSIPGRLLVMMPGMSRLGVSRKVEDEDARDKARSALSELVLPPDMGFIVRTAGIDRPKRELQRDLNYLLRLWKAVKQQIKRSRIPSEIYQESDLVTRTIRDIYSAEIERVICDSPAVARQVEQFLNVAVPRGKHSVELYTGQEGLYYESGLEAEIEKIHARRVELPMGGSLIFDQAEALVAIDVNSGRFRQHSDAETTALKINLQAAGEIARQLRLRDMGGVIIIDFIDMREEKNRRLLEKTLKDAMKPDRAKTKVLRTSAFGIIELTRQRLGPSLKQSYYNRCVRCDGLGVVQSEESLSLKIMRDIQRASADANVSHIEAVVPPEVAHFLLNRQRLEIARVEGATGKSVVIRADAEVGAGKGDIHCTNSRGAPVAWERPAVGKPERTTLQTIPISQVPPPAPAPAEGEAPPAGTPGTGTPPAMAGVQTEHGEIDFDEIEAAEIPYLDDEDAELDRMISATDLADQDEDEADLPAPAVGLERDEPVAVSTASAAIPAAGSEGLEGQAGELKKKRRGRRGGRKHRRNRDDAPEGARQPVVPQPAQAQGAPGQPAPARPQPQQPKTPAGEAQAPPAGESGTVKKKRRRRRRHKNHAGEPAGPAAQQNQAQPAPQRQPQQAAGQGPGESKGQAQPQAAPGPVQRAQTVQAQAHEPAKPAPAQMPAQPQPQAAPAGATTEAKPTAGQAAAKKPRRPRPPRRPKAAAKPAQAPAGPAAAIKAPAGEKPSGDTQSSPADKSKPAAKKPRRRRPRKATPGADKTDSPA